MYWNDKCCMCLYFNKDSIYKGWTGIQHFCDWHCSYTRATNISCDKFFRDWDRSEEEIREFEEEERTGVVRSKKAQPVPKYNYNYNNNSSSNSNDDWFFDLICELFEKRKKNKVKRKKK
ncbi:MAG: hypothetical protein IJI49_05945 [Bacilli bacterium]|nr:hypothetical protein [Bacilli bacterium]